MFFLIKFNKLDKTLRYKKLFYILLLYLKNFKIFKFENIKKKIINFDFNNFFYYNNFNLDIFFKM